MYAIAEIAGKQFKLRANEKVYIPRLQANVDDSVTFDRILLVSGNGDIRVGVPTVEGASVTARVVRHVKADKVYVFKKKRRKRYKVKRGHRQQYTQIEVGALQLDSRQPQA